MEEITLIDLVSMLLANGGRQRATNINILKSLYERDQMRLTNIVRITSGLMVAIIGAMAAAGFQGDLAGVEYVIPILAPLLVVVVIVLIVYSYRSMQITRKFLELVRIYNLLSRYF